MDNFTRLGFEKNFNIEKIITIFYMEFPKNFYYEGERHDFWEMVYIDKGKMVCTADQNRFILKSGEMTFHKPNEFHLYYIQDKEMEHHSLFLHETPQ